MILRTGVRKKHELSLFKLTLLYKSSYDKAMCNITNQWFGIKSADISNDLFPSERPLIL